MLNEVKHLHARRGRPFAEFPLSEPKPFASPSLRSGLRVTDITTSL